MKKDFKNIISKIIVKLPSPIINILMLARNLFRQDFATLLKVYNFVPPGHFYSPIPSIREIRTNEGRIFGDIPKSIAGINLNEERQWDLFKEISKYYLDLPFQDNKTNNLRYYYQNWGYGYSDAICLYGMMRHAKPRRIIEVGCGHSSCVMLDTNELFLQGSTQITFIEPYPDLLFSLLKKGDEQKITLISQRLQDVPLDIFKSLEENDILFIDSTHVCKINSDVNYLLFEILPRLTSGVFIHFHDIPYPFEYPKDWVYKGKAWNEAYFLRAFLQYNSSFEIAFFNTYLEYFYPERFQEQMPLCLLNPGGSIWLQKR
jgi:hypothetical protein